MDVFFLTQLSDAVDCGLSVVVLEMNLETRRNANRAHLRNIHVVATEQNVCRSGQFDVRNNTGRMTTSTCVLYHQLSDDPYHI